MHMGDPIPRAAPFLRGLADCMPVVLHDMGATELVPQLGRAWPHAGVDSAMLSGVAVMQSRRAGGAVREGVIAEADSEPSDRLCSRGGTGEQMVGTTSTTLHAADTPGIDCEALNCHGKSASGPCWLRMTG